MFFSQQHNLTLNLLNEPLQDQIQEHEQQSVESLDDILSTIHMDSITQSNIEKRIIIYLKQLKLHCKTDPRKKEYDYYEKQKKEKPYFMGSVDGSPCLEIQKQKLQ